MKHCVIFDMDGVIIDSEPFHTVCEKKIFQLLGITVSDEEHHSFAGTTGETMWSRIGSLHQLPLKVTEIIQLSKSLYMEYLKKEISLKPIPYVLELIADLYKNNFILVLASSSPREQINYILSGLGIGNYFHSVISAEDVKIGKPNPGVFLKAARLAGANPGSCIVIEDSFNGVTAAKNANMKCIGYINPNSGDQDLSKADVVVSSLKEISVGLIKNLLDISSYSDG